MLITQEVLQSSANMGFIVGQIGMYMFEAKLRWGAKKKKKMNK